VRSVTKGRLSKEEFWLYTSRKERKSKSKLEKFIVGLAEPMAESDYRWNIKDGRGYPFDFIEDEGTGLV
jgi:hypothetical protein